MSRTINTFVVGLGNVGRNFLRILEQKKLRLVQAYGLDFRIIGIADSTGMALSAQGFEPAAIRQAKERGEAVSSLPEFLGPLLLDDFATQITQLACDLVLEASPVNLQTGQPGLGIARAALQQGIGVVLANKGPLVLAFAELHRLAAQHQAGLAFSATVCGALPVINIGRRDLIAADIHLLRGIFNSTTNFILAAMQDGRTYTDALAEAQARGIAETDPTLDVEGWDTANKLVIIANSFLGDELRLDDVMVEGITGLTTTDLQQAQARGRTIKLVATAESLPSANGATQRRYQVAPFELPHDEFLAQCHGWEMGVEIHSDLYGKHYYKNWEREPLPTAAAMLRDAVNLFT